MNKAMQRLFGTQSDEEEVILEPEESRPVIDLRQETPESPTPQETVPKEPAPNIVTVNPEGVNPAARRLFGGDLSAEESEPTIQGTGRNTVISAIPKTPDQESTGLASFIWDQLASTVQLGTELTVGTFAGTTALLAGMGTRLGYAYNRAVDAYTPKHWDNRSMVPKIPGLEPKTADEINQQSAKNQQYVNDLTRDILYGGFAPEMEQDPETGEIQIHGMRQTAQDSLNMINKVFALPVEWVAEPVGEMYGTLTKDKVAGAMMSEAIEVSMFFALMPWAIGRTKIKAAAMNKRWIEKRAAKNVEKQQAGLKRRAVVEEQIDAQMGDSLSDLEVASKWADKEKAKLEHKASREAKVREQNEAVKKAKEQAEQADLDYMEELGDPEGVVALAKALEKKATKISEDGGVPLSAADVVETYGEVLAKYKGKRIKQAAKTRKETQAQAQTVQEVPKETAVAVPDKVDNVKFYPPESTKTKPVEPAKSAEVPQPRKKPKKVSGLKKEADTPKVEPVAPAGPKVVRRVTDPKTGETTLIPVKKESSTSSMRNMVNEVATTLENNETRVFKNEQTLSSDPPVVTKAKVNPKLIEMEHSSVLQQLYKDAPTGTIRRKRAEFALDLEQITDIPKRIEQGKKIEILDQMLAERNKTRATDPKMIKAEAELTAATQEAKMRAIADGVSRLKQKKGEPTKELTPEARRNLRVLDDLIDTLEGRNLDDIGASPYERSFYEPLRPLDEIFADVLKASDDRGVLGIDIPGLTKAQKAAYERISSDIQKVKRNAAKMGVDISEYLTKTFKLDPHTAEVMARHIEHVLDDDFIKEIKASEGRPGNGRVAHEWTLENQQAAKGRWKDRAKEKIRLFSEAFIERRESVERTLKRLQGRYPQAEVAQLELYARSSALPQAKRYWLPIRNEIFGILNRPEIKSLERYVTMVAERDTLKRHPDYKSGTLSKFGEMYKQLTTDDFTAGLREFQALEGLTDLQMKKIVKSAQDYFDLYKDLSRRKLDGGGLAQWQFDLLEQNSYSPTRWLHLMDAFEVIKGESGATVSKKTPGPLTFEDVIRAAETKTVEKVGSMATKDSGIYRLKGGQEGYRRMDIEQIAAEAVSANFRWIADNNAGKALAKLSKTLPPDNPYIRRAPLKTKEPARLENGHIVELNYQKPPQGWKELYHFEDGVRHTTWARDWFARQWNSSGSEFRLRYSEMIRWMSGAKILRAHVTGVLNPLFFTFGLPMDMMYGYFATMGRDPSTGKMRSIYSTVPEVYGAQLVRNMGLTFHDVVTRSGKFNEFVTHADFQALTHVSGYKPKASGKFRYHWDTLTDYSTYPNTTAEYWVRLAHMEQYKRFGYDTKMAAQMSKNVLDYAQGGELSKWIDTIVPYTNVAVLSTKKILGGAVDNKAQFAFKVAMIMGHAAGIHLYNLQQNPEAIRWMSDHTKNNFIPIVLGDLTADDGSKFYYSLKYRKDPATQWMWTSGEITAELLNGEPVDLGRLWQSFQDSAPYISGTFLPPVYAAYKTYNENIDTLTKRPIWSGDPAGSEEWKEYQSKLWYDLGQAFGMSPARLEAGLGALVTKRHPLYNGIGWAYDKVFRDIPKPEQETILATFLLDNWHKGIFAISVEPTKYREKFDEATEEVNAKMVFQNRVVDGYCRQIYKDDIDNADMHADELGAVISRQDPNDQDRMMARWQTYLETKDLKRQNTWMAVAGQGTATAKARAFYRWEQDPQISEATREEIWEGVAQLQSTGNIIPKLQITKGKAPAFWEEYYRLLEHGEYSKKP